MSDRLEEKLEQKKDAAMAAIREAGSLLVALSGGVDSAVLLALALEAVGPERVLAVTGRSESLPEEDAGDARAVAEYLGARHEEIATREMDRPGYRANLGDRCYHCRAQLFDQLEILRRERRIGAIAYGAIAEDRMDYRPGMRAAEERRVLAPLLDAGITKDDVRMLAEALRLPVRGKPAAACLSSRIPVGVEVTRERLSRIGAAERALRPLGLGRLRVRDHGDVARVELDAGGLERLADAAIRAAIVDAVRRAGFRFATVDLEGYRTGGGLDSGPRRSDVDRFK